MHDEIRFGPRRETRRWRPPGWALAAAVAIAVVVTLIVTHHGHRAPPRRPDLLAPVRTVGYHLLGVNARWRLITYGPAGLVLIQPSSGLIARTSVPILASTGPVSFLAGPRQAIIRPLDGVPGYLVTYGHRARPLTGLLASGGKAVPGPRPGQVLIQADYQARSLSLAWLDGRRGGPSMPMPRGTWETTPDGQGYALLTDVGQVRTPPDLFDLRPDGLHRVRGYLLAAGPHRWLTATCRHNRCTAALTDTASGTRRVLPGRVPRSELGQPGVIAPDGKTAALFGLAGSRITLQLISLATGVQRPVPVPFGFGPANWQTLAWSPDSRWLFVVAAHGRLAAVRASSGRPQGLGAALPPVSYIAIQG